MTKKITALLSAIFLVFTLSLALPLDSDAARMGGGKSFGSQPAMRVPTRTPTTQQARPQQAPTNQAAAAAGQPARGGLFSGFGGGLLGGLLAGTLLGSLLGGGAFAGVGMMDILLLLVIVGGVMYFLRRRRAAQQPAAQAAHGTNFSEAQNPYMQRNSVQDAWGAMSDNGGACSAAQQSNIPAGFDVEDFLRGAKMAYTRMQASWDRRDLGDIANFATDAVLEALREQMREDPNPGQTQIVLINASLISVEEFGDQDRAQVYFDVLMREDPNQTQPANAREIWHFVRAHETGTWKLDGIQQVESC